MNSQPDRMPISLQHISKSFGVAQVLHNISLDIAPGELLTLLGPSGCGKSTLLNVIAGFERADSGTVHIGGSEVSRVPARKRGIGIVFQAYSLFPHLTARANIEYGLKVMKEPRRRRAARSEELLHVIGLEDHAGKFPHELSGGQQQRVALARALATNPRVLLLDEPLSALDAIVRVRLREEIQRIQRDSGITTIMVTHDQEEALSIADRVAVMNEGRIEQVDTPQRVYATPATAFVADFIGAVNRLEGAPTREGIALFGEEVRLSVHRDEDSGRTFALVRPEQLALTPTGDGPGVVETLTLRGPLTTAMVRHPDHVEPVRIDLRTGEHPALRVGDRVLVRVMQPTVALNRDMEMEFA